MAVNTELCSKDRAVLPQSIWNGRPIWMKRQDEVARVKSDKVSVDGGHAGSDDDGHLCSTRQVDPHHPSHSLLRYDDSADPVKALKTRHSRDDMRFALFFSRSISLTCLRYNLTAYPLATDVFIMLLGGFGFLMTFLKRYGMSALGFTMIVTVIVTQFAIIVFGFAKLDEEFVIKLAFIDVTEGGVVAAAVLISFGAVLGKVNPLQVNCNQVGVNLICTIPSAALHGADRDNSCGFECPHWLPHSGGGRCWWDNLHPHFWRLLWPCSQLRIEGARHIEERTPGRVQARSFATNC